MLKGGDNPTLGRSTNNRPTILLVEDEMIIAYDLADRLEDAGFDVDGPHATVAAAQEAIANSTPQGAVLDVQLCDGPVYPAADRLVAMGVPIVFHSGNASPDFLRKQYPAAAICTKPTPVGELEARLSQLVIPAH